MAKQFQKEYNSKVEFDFSKFQTHMKSSYRDHKNRQYTIYPAADTICRTDLFFQKLISFHFFYGREKVGYRDYIANLIGGGRAFKVFKAQLIDSKNIFEGDDFESKKNRTRNAKRLSEVLGIDIPEEYHRYKVSIDGFVKRIMYLINTFDDSEDHSNIIRVVDTRTNKTLSRFSVFDKDAEYYSFIVNDKYFGLYDRLLKMYLRYDPLARAIPNVANMNHIMGLSKWITSCESNRAKYLTLETEAYRMYLRLFVMSFMDIYTNNKQYFDDDTLRNFVIRAGLVVTKNPTTLLSLNFNYCVPLGEVQSNHGSNNKIHKVYSHEIMKVFDLFQITNNSAGEIIKKYQISSEGLNLQRRLYKDYMDHSDHFQWILKNYPV